MSVTISTDIQLPNGSRPPNGFQVKLTYLGYQKLKIEYKFEHNEKWFELVQNVSPVDSVLTIPLKTAFVCYCKKNMNQVFEITRSLNEHGVLTWFDEDNLNPGTISPGNHILKKTLPASDHVLVFLSKEAIAGEGMQQEEIKVAQKISLEKNGSNYYMIPIVLDESPVPSNFSDIQYVRASDPRWLEKVLRIIKPVLRER